MAAVWVLIVAVIVRFIPNWWGRIVLFGVLVGIPFWELPYGYYNFQKLCREEAKLQIFEEIPPQDSVCIEHFDLGFYASLVKAGISRIEVTGRSDNAKNYLASGRVFLIPRKQAESSYCIAFKSNISLPWRMLRHDTLIERAGDRHVVARQSSFRWAGMWWQQQASPVLGLGGVCSDEQNSPVFALRKKAS